MEKELYDEKFSNVNLRLNNHEKRLINVEEKLIETDKCLAVSISGINASLESLTGLPKIISKVSENMTKMGSTMELMQVELKRNTEAIANLEKETNEKIKAISKNVKEIDEDGKFNFRQWIGQNFAKVVLSASAVLALVKYFFE